MRTYGVKDRFLFRDIAWLMGDLDVELVLDRMGIKPVKRRGNQIIALCPDHFLFVNRQPSHPKWELDLKTGKTFCFTEGRGSNLVYTVSRLRGCSAREGAAWMLELDEAGDVERYRLKRLSERIAVIQGGGASDDENPVDFLEEMREEIENGVVYESGYEFFRHPPGKDKMPTRILPKTVRYFRVVQKTSGFYANRVIVPFFTKHELVGFCAIDILGEEEWFKRNPAAERSEYKKVRYPLGSKTGRCIFGFDEIAQGAEFVILVEGARDVMKLWQEGFPDSGAVLGSSISSAQIVLLSEKHPRRVVVMMDGDQAGLDASCRIAGKLCDVFKVEVAKPPWGFDPKNLNHKQIGRSLAEAQPFEKKS